MKLKEISAIAAYERLHMDIGDEVRSAHSRAGFKNYSIFRDGLLLFAYFESDNGAEAFQKIEKEPIMETWWARTNPLMEVEGQRPYFRHLREVFHMD